MTIKNFFKNVDEGKEKHLPGIEIKECVTCGELGVTIQVGKEVIHPATPEHFIQTITLYGVTAENKIKQLTQFNLGQENTLARVRTTIKQGLFVQLIATSYCNLHGLWENFIELK